jgi:hypothetical protein
METHEITQPEEIAPEKPYSEESEAKYPDRPSDNHSVARCIRAWNRAFHKKLEELEDGDSEYDAREAGKDYYLRAMPPLAGLQNIRDFIACVTYAQLIDILIPREAESLLAAAKIALSAMRHEA